MVLIVKDLSFVNGFKHGYNILRRHIGQDIMDLLKDKAPAGTKNTG